jgi:hypothetical protein
MDPLLSSSMRQASFKFETPRLELKSSWTSLASKRCQCQGTKSKTVIKQLRISLNKLAHMCTIRGQAVKQKARGS